MYVSGHVVGVVSLRGRSAAVGDPHVAPPLVVAVAVALFLGCGDGKDHGVKRWRWWRQQEPPEVGQGSRHTQCGCEWLTD